MCSEAVNILGRRLALARRGELCSVLCDRTAPSRHHQTSNCRLPFLRPELILDACSYLSPHASVHARNINSSRRRPSSEQHPLPFPHYLLGHFHHGGQRRAACLRAGAGSAQYYAVGSGPRAEGAGTPFLGTVPEVGMWNGTERRGSMQADGMDSKRHGRLHSLCSSQTQQTQQPSCSLPPHSRARWVAASSSRSLLTTADRIRPPPSAPRTTPRPPRLYYAESDDVSCGP